MMKTGVARKCIGCMSARAPPRAEIKKLGPNLQVKVVSAPQAERAPLGTARVQFLKKLGRSGQW